MVSSFSRVVASGMSSLSDNRDSHGESESFDGGVVARGRWVDGVGQQQGGVLFARFLLLLQGLGGKVGRQLLGVVFFGGA